MKINKPKRFNNLVIKHFFKGRILVKWLKVAVISNKNIWDNITIVVAKNALHKEFDYIISKLLGQGQEKALLKYNPYYYLLEQNP